MWGFGKTRRLASILPVVLPSSLFDVMGFAQVGEEDSRENNRGAYNKGIVNLFAKDEIGGNNGKNRGQVAENSRLAVTYFRDGKEPDNQGHG